MADIDLLKKKLGLVKGDVKLDSSSDVADPKLVALAEYDAALHELAGLEEKIQAAAKRYDEARIKLNLALMGKE